MISIRRLLLVAAMLPIIGCGTQGNDPQPAPSADDRVKALADAYLEGWFARNPDQGTYYGVPGRRHDQLPDNSLEALAAWQTKEDAWLAEARAIDPGRSRRARSKAPTRSCAKQSKARPVRGSAASSSGQSAR